MGPLSARFLYLLLHHFGLRSFPNFNQKLFPSPFLKRRPRIRPCCLISYLSSQKHVKLSFLSGLTFNFMLKQGCSIVRQQAIECFHFQVLFRGTWQWNIRVLDCHNTKFKFLWSVHKRKFLFHDHEIFHSRCASMFSTDCDCLWLFDRSSYTFTY